MPTSPHPRLDPEAYHHLRAVAATLADQLDEHTSSVRYRLWQIVRTLGEEQSLALLDETHTIESGGGLLIGDQSRRRTMGGVYFHLARQRLKDDPAFFWIFGNRQATKSEKLTKDPPSTLAQPVVPPAPPFLWAERQAVIEEALHQVGGHSTMKVTLVGRPSSKVIEKDQFVLLAMPTQTIPALPKGIPVPPEQTQTQVLVYIAMKQWKKVAEALANPEDALIVEGFGIYEPQINGLAVLATNVTTKGLQQAKRQSEPSASRTTATP